MTRIGRLALVLVILAVLRFVRRRRLTLQRYSRASIGEVAA